MVHGSTLGISEYPNSLDNEKEFIPDLIFAWSSAEALKMEIPKIKAELEQADT